MFYVHNLFYTYIIFIKLVVLLRNKHDYLIINIQAIACVKLIDKIQNKLPQKLTLKCLANR